MLKINKFVEEKVIEIIQKKISNNNDISITSESSFDELNIDSLDFIEIIIAVEDVFGIEFTDEALYMGKFRKVCDFTSYISEMITLSKRTKNE